MVALCITIEMTVAFDYDDRFPSFRVFFHFPDLGSGPIHSCVQDLAYISFRSDIVDSSICTLCYM